ncbi:MAG TPA: DUF3644 domain-containing protein [Egibacteraceae bacterium]|nr:DUF3644 domain-containing protein [Egibacteraceae bacterium]
MAQRPKWWHQLQAAKNEARLGVDLYNRPTESRSLEGFVVHMHLAWLYLLHAQFVRDGVDFRYREKGGRRFVKVDGEPKTWELARCLEEAFGDDDPVRRNIEFFIKLRNRIEHRYESLLASVVAGKVQAHVLNFEETLVRVFGNKEGMADVLRFPVFMSSLTPDAVDILKKTHRQLPKKLTTFIREFDAAQPEEVQSDWRYDFRVVLLPQTGPKTEADAVMRFLREEEMTPEQKDARDVVQTIIRTKQVPVQNKGKHKPSAVAKKVSEQLGFEFTVHGHHTRAWKHYGVRPEGGADRPELTDEKYCVWDEPHGDYLYTDAWVRKLVKDLANPSTFKKVTGSGPKKLPGAATRSAKAS